MNVNNMYKSQLNKVIEHVKLFKFEILKSGSKHDMTGNRFRRIVVCLKHLVLVIDRLKWMLNLERSKNNM